jgi:hypothetical protein
MVGNDGRSGISSSAHGRFLGLPGCPNDSWGPPDIANADGVDVVAVDLEWDTSVEPPDWMFILGSPMGVATALGALEVADMTCEIVEGGFVW